MIDTARTAKVKFSKPYGQFLSMLIVCGMIGGLGYIAYPRVGPVFLANPMLNGFILLVFALGVYTCFRQVLSLAASVRWTIYGIS